MILLQLHGRKRAFQFCVCACNLLDVRSGVKYGLWARSWRQCESKWGMESEHRLDESVEKWWVNMEDRYLHGGWKLGQNCRGMDHRGCSRRTLRVCGCSGRGAGGAPSLRVVEFWLQQLQHGEQRLALLFQRQHLVLLLHQLRGELRALLLHSLHPLHLVSQNLQLLQQTNRENDFSSWTKSHF